MRPVNRNSRLARHWSNQILRTVAPLASGDVANISGWQDRDKQGKRYRDYFSAANSYSVSNHTGERAIEDAEEITDFQLDLTAELPEDLRLRFDVVFNHTTLEHILDAPAAFRNLCEMSRDAVIIVVPFAQRLHYTDSWGDFWRFTPMSLRALFAENRMQVVYEAASPYRDAGIYLFFVASRHPERWRDRLPPWQPIERLGDWIGETTTRRLYRYLASMLGR